MRIYKYIHSCLLLDHQGEKLLFDPGKFTFVEGRVTPDTFSDVSIIVLTPDHPDHLNIAALKEVVARSGARVLSNGAVASKLRREAVEVTVLEEGMQQAGAFTLWAIPAQHEPILSDSLPHNTAFLVNERVLNPGDSFQPSLFAFRGIELLILPVLAPWLTELAVADFARQMNPKQVLPVHDGYAKDFFLKQCYETYQTYFEELNIVFHELMEPGACITLDE